MMSTSNPAEHLGEPAAPPRSLRCAIYTRKSTEDGLNQPFNTLEAQREAAEAYIVSQRNLGWSVVAEHYDDGGYTGGNLERPALQKLLTDLKVGKIDCVVIYKVDRLSRSLLDFARLMEIFERHQVSLVSVTQPLNTTTSLGRLTLNILLSPPPGASWWSTRPRTAGYRRSLLYIYSIGLSKQYWLRCGRGSGRRSAG